ncbi:putative membrane protein [Bradyrhizobium sp. JR4.1]
MGSWTFIIIQSVILCVWTWATWWDDQALGSLPAHSSQSRAFVPGGRRRASHHDEPQPAAGHRSRGGGERLRINVKAELEIELLHEKIDQLREREILKLTEAVRTLTVLLEEPASGARESDAEGGGRS